MNLSPFFSLPQEPFVSKSPVCRNEEFTVKLEMKFDDVIGEKEDAFLRACTAKIQKADKNSFCSSVKPGSIVIKIIGPSPSKDTVRSSVRKWKQNDIEASILQNVKEGEG